MTDARPGIAANGRDVPLQLADEVYLARVGDRCIALDLARDRYIGLGAGLSAALADLDETQGVIAEPARSKLLAKGVLVPGPGRAPAAPIPSAVGSLEPFMERRIWSRPAGGLSALAALWDVDRCQRRGSFHDFIRWLRGRHRIGLRPASDLTALVHDFVAARPWYPTAPICRLDAPSLCLHLWRSGLEASLIFGVRLDPFAAHCWAECGLLVLNEPAEIAMEFTPILSV
jgi:hypothetical protein